MLTVSESVRMNVFRAQNFRYEARGWLLMERRVSMEWKGLDIMTGPRIMRKELERIWR
jgi:hypothetical protein